MKIALIHSFYSNETSSGENVVVMHQKRALESLGVEVLLCAQNSSQLSKLTSITNGLKHSIFGEGSDPSEKLQEFNPDYVFVHNLFPNWGVKWLENCPFKVVAFVHNFRTVCSAGTLSRDGKRCQLCVDGSSINAVLHKCYKQSVLASVPMALMTRKGAAMDPLLARADAVVTLNEEATEFFKRQIANPEKIFHIPNFVEFAEPHSSQTSNNGSKWLYVGRLTQEKGILQLLELWPSDANLRIVGEGPLEHEVEAVSAKHANVEFFGKVSAQSVQELLNDSLGLVLPSVWAEGLPMVYLEALASGVPVIAKDGNSIAAEVELESLGAIYTDASSLIVALNTVANDHELSLRCTKFVRHKYSKEAWFASLRGVFRQVSVS